jgi:hypothetical protein
MSELKAVVVNEWFALLDNLEQSYHEISQTSEQQTCSEAYPTTMFSTITALMTPPSM